MQDREHGGNIWHAAKLLNTSPEDILDFSASLNPLGPPPWIAEILNTTLIKATAYPDPNYTYLRKKAAAHYKVRPEHLFPLNGSSEIFPSLAKLCQLKEAIIFQPSYLEYELWAKKNGFKVKELFLSPDSNFSYPLDLLEKELSQKPKLIFLAHPNNPTGSLLEKDTLFYLANKFKQSFFIVDLAFNDFLPDSLKQPPLIADNILFLYSLTKILSLPGLRIGFALSSEQNILKLQDLLPTWSVSTFAQEVALAYFNDTAWSEKTQTNLLKLKDHFRKQSQKFPWQTYISSANFLLITHPLAQKFREFLFQNKVLVRKGDNFKGLGSSYLRLALRPLEEQEKFFFLAQKFFFPQKSTFLGKPKKQALMIQGTASNAGKSLLVTALCRILAKKGLKVAPFKAQNMALNSFVTQEGLEMGRAQVLQAQACFLEPKVSMNPILLKPSSDLGAQVIVKGKPIGNLSVEEYIKYKPKAFEIVKECFEELKSNHELILIEGAGSPAEINLKEHDIVNMKMALYAKAPVLLVGDINLGGIFASFWGTYLLLTLEEQKHLLGFVINKFRGKKELLSSGLKYLEKLTHKPTLGIIPYFDLNLPEEDSVSFKEKQNLLPKNKEIRIGIVDLPHISNFTDFSPLKEEPDVELIILRSAQEIKNLDVLILPGSKNVFADLQFLHTKGFFKVIQKLALLIEIVGICGGYQMLGHSIFDPHYIEGQGEVPGLSLLELKSSYSPQKTLKQTQAIYLEKNLKLSGYEIHHGQTTPLTNLIPLFKSLSGEIIGYKHPQLKVWGTYLHGLFDNDSFRHFWLNRIRKRKKLLPLKKRPCFDLNSQLDKLADVVEKNINLDYILNHLGY